MENFIGITYLVLLFFLTIVLIIELFCICEFGFCFKYNHKIKTICDFIFDLSLFLFGLLNCFLIPNYYINFLAIYILLYDFVKWLIGGIIINPIKESLQIKLQSYNELDVKFNNIFVYCKTTEEQKTLWITKHAENNLINIYLNGKYHQYKLKYRRYKNSLNYLIKQIQNNAQLINNKKDLENLTLKVIRDKNLDEIFANSFIPHQRIKRIKKFKTWNNTLFNLFMLSLLVPSSLLFYLIYKWKILTLYVKIFYSVFCVLFTLLGPVAIPFCIYLSQKSSANKTTTH